MPVKVMISSTAHDLPAHRQAVGEACRALKYEAVMMEDLPALDADAIEASLALVEEADVYVGIFAHRYGHIPTANNPDRISITEMEYRHAVHLRKPRLIFVVGEDHVPGLEVEQNPESAAKLAAFKARVTADRVVQFFTSPDHLRAGVVQALTVWEKQGFTWMPDPLPDPDYLPTTYMLPPGSFVGVGRAQYFVGREELLLELAQTLVHGGGEGKTVIKPAVAVGAGGIGKTVLAVEFAHRFGRYFYGVHWINLFGVTQVEDLEAHLRAEIASNGRRMSLQGFPEDDLPRQAQLTLDAWHSTPLRLLVLDNAESPEIVRQALRMFPGMRVLVTSRWGEDGDWRVIGVEPRALNTLTRLQSITLLRDLAPHLARAADDAMSALAARLGDYPLALYLAGRYLDRMQRRGGGLSIEAYLARLDDQGLAHPAFTQAAQTHDPALAHHHLNVAHCLGLSWHNVTDPLAQRLFRACGYLAPNTPIPPAVLLSMADGDYDALALALTQLVQYGLLAPFEGGDEETDAARDHPTDAGERLAIHPLLADFARELDGEHDEAERQLARVADALIGLTHQANQTGLPDRFVPLRTHVEAVAEWADTAGLAEAGTLWNNLGYHQNIIADYAATRRNFERAVAIARRVHGPDHPTVALRLNNLGSLLQDLGDLNGARQHYEQALAIDERAYGPNHTSVATDLNNLGSLLRQLGDLPAARQNYERVLRILDITLPPDHSYVAATLNNLGLVLHDLGELRAARDHFERALAINEKGLGLDHPTVGIRLNNLGLLLQDLGELDAARDHFERALAIGERVFGPDHPTVAIRLNNLGSLLRDLGELDTARDHFERALDIRERIFGPNHTSVAQSLNNLGSLLHDLGDLPTARRYYERVLHILELTIPSDHPYVAATLNNLANLVQMLGDLPTARGYLERALRILESKLPPGHPDIENVRRGLELVNDGVVPRPTMTQMRYFLQTLPGERRS